MSPEQEQLLASIEACARSLLPAGDPAHDVNHVERVAATAHFLLRQESLEHEPDVAFPTLAACWLHDLVQTKKGTSAPGADANDSADAAEAILADLKVPADAADLIVAAVREHSFSSGQSPSSLASAFLQDADRIDALGSIGIARLWSVAGTTQSALYDPEDPAAQRRPIDDRSYALDHVPAKLLGLPATLCTTSGRKLAGRRVRTVFDFYKNFLRELEVEPPIASPLLELLMDGAIQARLIFPGVPTPRLLDAARALDAAPEQILKTLLFVSPAGDAVMAIASGPQPVSDAALQEQTGLKNLKLANPEVVRHRAGYEVGAVPPVGLPGELPVIVDTGVTELGVAYGGGGRVDALLQITPREIIRVNEARVARIVA